MRLHACTCKPLVIAKPAQIHTFVLRTIGTETAKILRDIDPGKLSGIIANYYQSLEQQ